MVFRDVYRVFRGMYMVFRGVVGHSITPLNSL